LHPDAGSSAASAAKPKLIVTGQHRMETTAYFTTDSGARINHGRSILFVERSILLRLTSKPLAKPEDAKTHGMLWQ
jgi:hypothetical protein